MSKPRWLRDPAGRHGYRLWDGEAWTARVADGGEEGEDALAGRTFGAPARWRMMLPSLAGVAAAVVLVGIVALVAMLTRSRPRDIGTFRLQFTDHGEYEIHRVTLQPGDTLHAKLRVAGGTVRLGLGIPSKVLDEEPGYPLNVVLQLGHRGAVALLSQTGNPALDKALVHARLKGTVAFPGFAGRLATDHAVVRARPPGQPRPGSLRPFTATVGGTYDLIIIGEQPGAKALLDVYVTRGDSAVDLGTFGSVVQPDSPPHAQQVLKDLLRGDPSLGGGGPLQQQALASS